LIAASASCFRDAASCFRLPPLAFFFFCFAVPPAPFSCLALYTKPPSSPSARFPPVFALRVLRFFFLFLRCLPLLLLDYHLTNPFPTPFPLNRHFSLASRPSSELSYVWAPSSCPSPGQDWRQRLCLPLEDVFLLDCRDSIFAFLVLVFFPPPFELPFPSIGASCLSGMRSAPLTVSPHLISVAPLAFRLPVVSRPGLNWTSVDGRALVLFFPPFPFRPQTTVDGLLVTL